MKYALALILSLASPLAMAATGRFSMDGLIDLVIWLALAACVYYLAKWLIGELGLEAPFDKIVRILVALIFFIFVMNALFSGLGSPFIPLGPFEVEV